MSKKENLILRELLEKDCAEIIQAFKEQGWTKPISLYQDYLKMQSSGERDIIVASQNGLCAGYLTINWNSHYTPFKENGIPEIVDLNVFKKFQRKGIATILISEAERRIRKVSTKSGIGFGLISDYGAAQILYIKLGYLPDGRGMIYDNRQLAYGDNITVGDDQTLFLTKTL